MTIDVWSLACAPLGAVALPTGAACACASLGAVALISGAACATASLVVHLPSDTICTLLRKAGHLWMSPSGPSLAAPLLTVYAHEIEVRLVRTHHPQCLGHSGSDGTVPLRLEALHASAQLGAVGAKALQVPATPSARHALCQRPATTVRLAEAFASRPALLLDGACSSPAHPGQHGYAQCVHPGRHGIAPCHCSEGTRNASWHTRPRELLLHQNKHDCPCADGPLIDRNTLINQITAKYLEPRLLVVNPLIECTSLGDILDEDRIVDDRIFQEPKPSSSTSNMQQQQTTLTSSVGSRNASQEPNSHKEPISYYGFVMVAEPRCDPRRISSASWFPRREPCFGTLASSSPAPSEPLVPEMSPADWVIGAGTSELSCAKDSLSQSLESTLGGQRVLDPYSTFGLYSWFCINARPRSG